MHNLNILNNNGNKINIKYNNYTNKMYTNKVISNNLTKING